MKFQLLLKDVFFLNVYPFDDTSFVRSEKVWRS